MQISKKNIGFYEKSKNQKKGFELKNNEKKISFLTPKITVWVKGLFEMVENIDYVTKIRACKKTKWTLFSFQIFCIFKFWISL